MTMRLRLPTLWPKYWNVRRPMRKGTRPRVSTMSAAATAICLLTASAHSQGIAAHATVSSQSPDAAIKALRQEVSALEGRVHELEKKADDVKDSDDVAKDKAFEQKLTAIEQAEEKLQTEMQKDRKEDEKKESQAEHGSSTIKAPFLVTDDGGHIIFSVEMQQKNNSPRMTIGNPSGAHILLGASDAQKVSAILMFDGTSATEKAYLYASNTSFLRLKSSDGNHEADLGSGPDGKFGISLWKDSIGSAVMTSSGAGAGWLGLANPKGEVVAEGGVKPNGVGIFRTGPACCDAPGAVGPHQYIVGKKD
jgi:hypothetical protein